MIANALSGAAGGDVTGSLGGLVQASAVNVLQGLATTEAKHLADGLGGSTTERETARAALQAVVGCAGQAAGGASDCGSAGLGAASAVVLNNLLSSGATTATDRDGKPLTLEAQQARDHLVSILAAAVAAGAGLDAHGAVTSAQIETQNNSTKTAFGSYGPDSKHGLPVALVYENDAAFKAAVDKLGGLTAFNAVSDCANKTETCVLSPDQQAALDAYSLGSQKLASQRSGATGKDTAELAAFKRQYDSLSDAAKAQVRSDLAASGEPSQLGEAFATVLASLASPDTLRDLYFLEVQGRANASDFVAGVGDAAKPAAQFPVDLKTVQDHLDPETGTVSDDAEYRVARDRLSRKAAGLAAEGKDAGGAIGQFVADVQTIHDHTDPDTTTVSDDAAYQAARTRLSQDISALKAAPGAVLAGATGAISKATDACALGGNADSRACGNAATILGADVGLTLAPAALSARFAAAGVELETAVDAGISWGKGIAAQGYPWEDYIAAQLPADARLPANFPVIDFFDEATGRAISAKTLDTATASRIARPEQIYSTLKGYVDKLTDFEGDRLSGREVKASEITSREISLAVPSATTPAQFEQIVNAARYAKVNGVTLRVMVTK
ncbi:hypothetical protein F4693_001631 [Sphingomonas endophytica]|uniref:CdiA toxin EC869-like domain-containing protein n=1 Tax=Sphingomonas endophytica TaxID=869719 RepID=A0A7X0JBS4_9SPHN|nr:hypothetical protein [Sphingomonas endophytica]MBB6504658.1 hypothetical protein [Sphingomonas endophytica]